MTYFTDEELKCPHTGIVKLHPGFLEALNDLRIAFNKPMIVNSCCRSKEHNNIIGGHVRSLHVYDEPFHPINGCMAVDISTRGWSFKELSTFIELAENKGWSVGIAKTFVHIDRRVDIGINQTWYVY